MTIDRTEERNRRTSKLKICSTLTEIKLPQSGTNVELRQRHAQIMTCDDTGSHYPLGGVLSLRYVSRSIVIITFCRGQIVPVARVHRAFPRMSESDPCTSRKGVYISMASRPSTSCLDNWNHPLLSYARCKVWQLEPSVDMLASLNRTRQSSWSNVLVRHTQPMMPQSVPMIL